VHQAECEGARWAAASLPAAPSIVGNLPGDVRERDVEDIFYKVRHLLLLFDIVCYCLLMLITV